MIKKNIKDCDMQELLGIIKQYNHLVRNRVVVPQKYQELVKAVREEIDKRNKEQNNGKNKNYNCKWCGEDLTTKDLYISADGWAYCCKCSQPLCDVSVQDKDHFIKINLDKIPQAVSFKKKFKELEDEKC